MKIKPQVNGIHATNKKQKSILTITKGKQQKLGSGITKNGKLSQKQSENKIKLKPKAAKQQESKSGKDENVITLKSLNAKNENNPIHPLFLKRVRKDVEQVSEIAVPSEKKISVGNHIKKKKLNKPKAAKEQGGKSGREESVIKFKSLNAKNENNPIHPLFLKRVRKDVKQVSEIAVPSEKRISVGKQIKGKKLNKPKAAKEQGGKSGREESIIKFKSLNAKNENNSIHPLVLKQVRKDVEQVSEIAVPSENISSVGKQIKKKKLKKAKLSGQNKTQNKSKAQVSNVKVSPVIGKIKILLKKKNKKKKSKIAQQQVNDNNKSAITDEKNQLSLPESPISTENDQTTSKKRKRNKNKKLKHDMLEENQLERTENVEESVDEDDNNTIFVGNLPNSVKKGAIVNIFKNYGKIRSIRLRSAAQSDQRIPKKIAVITKDFHQDTNSLNAFVTFAERFEARNALVTNGSIFDGHHIRVDYAKPEIQHNNRVAIFVGNLPFAVRDDELWEAFKNCGEIKSVRVIRDKATRIGKGFGYVNFKSPDGVELALQLEGISIQKRKLRIARASDPKTGQQTNKKNKPRKRKFSSSDNKNNEDSVVQTKKMKQEINKLTHESDEVQESKKQKFQGEKSAERRLKKQTLKKKVKKMRNEKHKKSVASLLTSKTGKGIISKKKA